MKVLVADPFEKSGLEGLEAAGCDVVFEPALKEEALATALRDTRAEVLVVRSTKVTAPMMDGGDLALIVRAGAGYNTIDVAAASARGVYVSNCPGKNATAVAELAFGLIIALDRRIPDNVAELRAGRWDKTAFAKAKGLKGRTLGLLGFGTIAQEVARRAQAFGLDLAIWSRRFDGSAAGSLADVSVLDGYGLDTSGRRSRVSIAAIARRGRVRGGHPEHPPRSCRRDSRPRQRRRHRTAAAGSDPRQYVASRGPRPRRSRRRRPRARDPRRSGRFPRRADDRHRANSTCRSSTCRASTAPTTSGRPRNRLRRRSPPRRSGSSGRSARPGGFRMSSIWRRGRRPATCSSFATGTGRVSSRTSSKVSLRQGSTSSRPRT